MCTFLNGRLAAYTGDPIPEPQQVVETPQQKAASLPAFSGEREPIRFMGASCEARDPAHRTNDKGGWIARNRGKKPEYKDRRLRAEGSGKTRIKDAED